MVKKTTASTNPSNDDDNPGESSGGEDRQISYTDQQLQFLELLKKYPVKLPETIVDYVTSQGEDVLENPVKLAGALRECDITPVRRHQILKHWFADKGIAVSHELLQSVVLDRPGMSSDGGDETTKRKKDKYTVDRETGDIVVASGDDNAISYDEAVKLSEKKKTEIKAKEKGTVPKYIYDPETNAIRMAKDGEQGGTMEEAKELKVMADKDAKKEPESPFMQTEDGQWAVVPGAKLSTLEMFTWQAMQKAAAAGQPVDPMDEMLKTGERLKALQGLFGGGSSIPDWMKDPEQFRKMMTPVNSGDNEAVKALNTKIDQMIADQHKAETEQLKTTITALTTQVESYKTTVESYKEELAKNQRVTGKTIYDLVGVGVDRIPKTSEILEGLKQITQNPPRLPQGGPADVSKRLENAAGKLEEAGVLKKAGDDWFNFR
jgi:hypothetical protein